MKKPLKQRLTMPLTACLVLILAAIGGWIYMDSLLSGPITVTDVKVDTQAALKLNLLRQVSKKEGITEWELTARTATLLKEKNQAVLEQVTVVFHTKEGGRVTLTSNKGLLNTRSHDMRFSDHVVVTYGDRILKTDKLQYIKKEHIIRSDAHVTLEQGRSVIEADRMTTRLNQNATTLEGHVKGHFYENFELR